VINLLVEKKGDALADNELPRAKGARRTVLKLRKCLLKAKKEEAAHIRCELRNLEDRFAYWSKLPVIKKAAVEVEKMSPTSYLRS
jgi:hypothetical protein